PERLSVPQLVRDRPPLLGQRTEPVQLLRIAQVPESPQREVAGVLRKLQPPRLPAHRLADLPDRGAQRVLHGRRLVGGLDDRLQEQQSLFGCASGLDQGLSTSRAKIPTELSETRSIACVGHKPGSPLRPWSYYATCSSRARTGSSRSWISCSSSSALGCTTSQASASASTRRTSW